MKHLIAGLVLAFAIVGAAGCGGSQKPTTKTATCADAGANSRAHAMASPEADARAADGMSATLTERCSADGWSAEAITCMATADQQTMGNCPSKLTADQQSKFIAAIAALAGQAEAPAANEFDNAGGE